MKCTTIILIVLTTLLAVSSSYAQNAKFNNPIAEKRADPWVYKTDDGIYYLIATVPEYDRIVIRKAKSINGLKEAEEIEVWHKHEKGVMGGYIWAPELHRIEGKWYIYFAAGDAENVWNIRMWALSNDSDNPMEGEWKEEGRIITDVESFSLDATTFEHKGKRYLIWAQYYHPKESASVLVISEMKDPVTLTGSEIIITKPEFNWERIKYNVNEGPAVLKRNGKIFVTYSASATNENYCIGLLWIDANDDILDAKNWHKSPGPVFYTNEDEKRFGPGHNSFTTSEDGKDVMIYHARDYKEIEGAELDDQNRGTRARVIQWTEKGFPDFMQKIGD